MRFYLISIVLLFGSLFHTAAAITHASAPSAAAAYLGAPESERTFRGAEVADLLNTDRRALESELGRKLTLKQRLVLRVAKSQVRRAQRRGDAAVAAAPEDNGTGLILGILLGVVLGLIGVLIAFLLRGKQPGILKGAWIGLGIIVGIILIASLAAAGGS